MKNVIITGGNKGLGLAQSKLFAQKGWHVFIVARSEGDASQMPQGSYTLIKQNLADWRNIDWIDELINSAGRIDSLVNNAGVHLKKPVWEVTGDELENVLDINVKVMFSTCGRFIEKQKEVGGSIVNVSSMGGIMALQSSAAYVTAKTAVIGLTRSIAVDAAPYDFRSNAVCPGFIETDMTRAILAKDPARRDKIEGRIPSHKFGTPENIAKAIHFLASDDAQYINGVTLPVDDGYSIGF